MVLCVNGVPYSVNLDDDEFEINSKYLAKLCLQYSIKRPQKNDSHWKVNNYVFDRNF